MISDKLYVTLGTSNDIEDEPLELTDEMIERNDEIDNCVYECICTLAEKEIEWDMHIIGDVIDSIKTVLDMHNIKVRHPGICEDDDGKQYYCE